MPEIEIRFASDQEYERLRRIKDKYGVHWRGMLIQGARRLEGRRPPPRPHATRQQPCVGGSDEAGVPDRTDRPDRRRPSDVR